MLFIGTKSLKMSVDPFDSDTYEPHKIAADRCFFLKNRNETWGVGGLVFDDYNTEKFDNLMKKIINAIIDCFQMQIEIGCGCPLNLYGSSGERYMRDSKGAD